MENEKEMKRDLPEENEMYEHFRFQVDPGQSLLRIDKYLLSKLENASRTRIQNAAKAGNILVNGNTIKANYKVKPNDQIAILLSEPPRDTVVYPEEMPLNILFEDADIIVINKPAGLVVHPGHGNFTGTLLNGLKWHLKDAPESEPFLAHRIDKDTSGVMLAAKNELAQSRLAKQFFHHTIQRKYNALVWGDFIEEEGTIEGHIGRHPKDRLQMTVFEDGEQGKHAITHWKVLERFGYVSFIECQLETGRTHQIRAHMKHIKHPLFNDARYGGDQILKGTTFTKYKQFIRNCYEQLPRQALHAKSLGFTHPTTGEQMFFESALTPNFQAVIEKWRNYSKHQNLEDEYQENMDE